MMSNQRFIELLNFVEANMESLWVGEEIEGHYRKVPLTQLPPKLAVKHTCQFVINALELVERKRQKAAKNSV